MSPAVVYTALKVAQANFGQRTFAYTAPTNVKCLTVENLSDPTGAAAEPNKYFDVRSNLGAQFTDYMT